VHIRPSVFLRAGAPAPTRPRGLASPPENAAILRLLTPAVNAGSQKSAAGPARAPSATSATCDRSAFIRLCRIPRPQENAACTSYPSQENAACTSYPSDTGIVAITEHKDARMKRHLRNPVLGKPVDRHSLQAYPHAMNCATFPHLRLMPV